MTYAVIAAMNSEIAPFLQGLKPSLPSKGFRGDLVRIYQGQHNGKGFVVAAAGLGKVNAALTTQLVIDRFSPEVIFQVGLAGACDPDLDIGDLVIGQKFYQHDMDLTPLQNDIAPGEVLFDVAMRGDKLVIEKEMRMPFAPADPQLVDLARKVAKRSNLVINNPAPGHTAPKIITGNIVSGDQFIFSAEKTKWLSANLAASAVEMESAAVAHVCFINNVRFVGIRAISDKADHSALVDIAACLKAASHNYHEIILNMITELG